MNPYPLRKRVQHALHHRQKGFTTVGLLALIASTIGVCCFVATVVPVEGQAKVIGIAEPQRSHGVTSKPRLTRAQPAQSREISVTVKGVPIDVQGGHGSLKPKVAMGFLIEVHGINEQTPSFWEEAQRMKQTAPIKGEDDGALYEIAVAKVAPQQVGYSIRVGKRLPKTIKISRGVPLKLAAPLQHGQELELARSAQVSELVRPFSSKEMQHLKNSMSQAEVEIRKSMDLMRHEMAKAEIGHALKAARISQKSIAGMPARAEIEKAIQSARLAQIDQKANLEVAAELSKLHEGKLKDPAKLAQFEAERASLADAKLHVASSLKSAAELHKHLEAELATLRDLHLKLKRNSKIPKKSARPSKK